MFANTPVSQPASSNDSARRKTNEVRPKQYFGGLKLKLTAAALIFGVIALVAAACGESEDEANQVAPSTTQEVTSTTQVAPSTTQPEARQAETEQDAARPQVAATIDIWASVVEDMTCGQVDVTTIIPSGSDPHHYEPVPQDIIALQNADLVVVNGFNLEETLLDNPNIPDDALMISDLAEEDEHDDEEDEDGHGDEEDEEEGHDDHDDEEEGIDEEDEDGHGDEEDEEEGHDDHDDEEDEDSHGDEHGHSDDGDDPHLWFDFHIVEEAVEQIAGELSPLVSDAEALEDCTESYLAELEETESFVSERLLSVPEASRILVTQHQTLERLADRYGYTILGSLIPSTSTLAEADIRNTIELEEAIQEGGVKAIFVDVSGDNSDVQNFAERAGVQAVSLYTETLSESGGEADSYLKLMRVNSQRIADALA